MRAEPPKAEFRGVSEGLINLQDPSCMSSSSIMDVRTTKNLEGKKIDYRRAFSQGHGGKMFPVKYFSLESLLLLVCLTASLLVLPLILPPLPPPPFMLLLLPICMLLVLMFLAFMPSNVRDIAYTYV